MSTVLTDTERRVLEVHCFDHAVATCADCQRDYKLTELGIDVIGRRYYFCPACHFPLLTELRLHILTCPTIAAALDERIDRSLRVVKESDRLTTQSAILAAESGELARHVLDTRRQSRHTASPSTLVERIAVALRGRRHVCAECVGREAGVAPDVVMKRIEGIRTSIRIVIDRGTCLECKRPDVTVMSFEPARPA